MEIDRRMLDFCVGLDTEFSEVVEGSHLYFPKTQIDKVNKHYIIVHHHIAQRSYSVRSKNLSSSTQLVILSPTSAAVSVWGWMTP